MFISLIIIPFSFGKGFFLQLLILFAMWYIFIIDIKQKHMKYTDNQKELLAFLPTELQTTKELTSAAKLILGNIINWYGTDYAKEHKEFYRTNTMMMEDTGIKSENSIISGRTLLEMKGYINFTSGKRGEATVYTLSNEVIDILQNSKNAVKKCSNNDVKNAVINCSNKSKNAVINCSETENCSKTQNIELQALINEVKEIKEILQCLSEKIAVINCSETNSKNAVINCSTDTESDKENISYISYRTWTLESLKEQSKTTYKLNDIDNRKIEVPEKQTENICEFQTKNEKDSINSLSTYVSLKSQSEVTEETISFGGNENAAIDNAAKNDYFYSEVQIEDNADTQTPEKETSNAETMKEKDSKLTDWQLMEMLKAEEMALWDEVTADNNYMPDDTMSATQIWESSERVNESDIEIMKQIHSDELEVIQHRGSTNTQLNEFFGKKLKRGYDILRRFRSSHTQAGAKAYAEEIDTIIVWLGKYYDQLTPKQQKAAETFDTAYGNAVDNKNAYFKGSKSNKATGAKNATTADKLSTADGKTCQKAQECPITQSGEILTVEELDLTMTTDTYNTEKKTAAVKTPDTDNASGYITNDDMMRLWSDSDTTAQPQTGKAPSEKVINAEEKAAAVETPDNKTEIIVIDTDTFNKYYNQLTDIIMQFSIFGDIDDVEKDNADKAFTILSANRAYFNANQLVLIDKAKTEYNTMIKAA